MKDDVRGRAETASGDGSSRGFPVDATLPRWVCQSCRNALCVVGVESYAEKFFNDPSRSGFQTSIQGSVMGSSKMDQSFVVLPKQKVQGLGVPPRPRTVNSQNEGSQPSKAMEESFVFLPPPAASMYKSETATERSGSHLPAQGGNQSNPVPANASGFNSTLTILSRAFEIATSQTQVEQPLCLDCMRVLSDKLDKEVEDVNRDIKAYEACLQQSEGEQLDILSDADFLKEKLKLEEEERTLLAAIEKAEKQCSEVDTELKDLDTKSTRFKELEERYWHEFNNFQFQLTAHQEQRDAILAKTEVCQAHLELLKRTNVLNDAFPISHDGEFGTINNFRLGRLPKIPVEWDEINAAWGQACLLLHTMAQHSRQKFPYRIKIIPMGSYPRIMDCNNNTYELFGPVNLFWSTRYDKAMTLFLTCLKDFADFAHSKDKENNIPPEKCFKLPYKIENDRVENYTITQSFNKQENWTKALKYTLCNLKWALYWFVGNSSFQPLSSTVSTQTETSAVK